MSDRELRELERAWSATRSKDDLRALLAARFRAGAVRPIVVYDYRLEEGQKRSKPRRVDEVGLTIRTQHTALTNGTWALQAAHGGTVSNSYGYPAWTEGAVCVCDPSGRALTVLVLLTANGTTERGVAEAVLPGLGDLFDGRVRKEERCKASRGLGLELHRQVYSELPGAPLPIASSWEPERVDVSGVTPRPCCPCGRARVRILWRDPINRELYCTPCNGTRQRRRAVGVQYPLEGPWTLEEMDT